VLSPSECRRNIVDPQSARLDKLVVKPGYMLETRVSFRTTPLKMGGVQCPDANISREYTYARREANSPEIVIYLAGFADVKAASTVRFDPGRIIRRVGK